MQRSLLCATVLALTSCGGSAAEPPHGEDPAGDAGGTAPDGGPSVTTATVGASGGTITAIVKEGRVTVVVPPGALSEDTALSIAVSPTSPAGVASPDSSPFLQRSFVVALSPHGTTFARPVTVTLEYAGSGNGVARLENDIDRTWERVAGAEVTPGDKARASFQTSTFSYYAVVTEGEIVSDVPVALVIGEGGARNLVMSPLRYDAAAVYWSEAVADASNSLKLWRLNLSEPASTAPIQVATVPRPELPADLAYGAADILITTNHLLWERYGTAATKDPTVDQRGNDVGVIRKDGTNYKPSIWAGHPLFVRGSSVVMDEPSYTRMYGTKDPRVFDVSMETGASVVLPTKLREIAVRTLEDRELCLYHAATDEVACAVGVDVGVYRLRVYNFKDDALRSLPTVTSGFGLEAMRQNATHWFAANTHDINAWPRSGGAPQTIPGGGWDRTTYAADDDFVYLCRAGDLTRIKLTDGAATVLSRDCGGDGGGSALGTGILGVDAKYVYYLGFRSSWSGAAPVLEVKRLVKP